MRTSNSRPFIYKAFAAFVGVSAFAAACGGPVKTDPTAAPIADVPAVRLNYRYEADVPAPQLAVNAAEEKNAAIQADFDQNRQQEFLDRTITSPDKKYVLAVYRAAEDRVSEYRLDVYSPDGKLVRKISSESMAVHFPDSISWSPNSMKVAFAAMTRGVAPTPTPSPGASPGASKPHSEPSPTAEASPAEQPAEATPAPETQPAAGTTPEAPKGLLTFGSEQIYICENDGTGVKPITQTEGLIYFYYAWAPDSSMLAALAITSREWDYFDGIAAMKGESWTPVGRLRTVETNGRERRLDDNLTAVRPVFSPDSTKVVTAFDTQVRIYDAVGTSPTQAAIPLRNQLLLSSQTFDREQQLKLQGQDTNVNANAAPAPMPDLLATTLPDPKTLVSFNPIVQVEWPQPELIYFRTAFVKRMQNAADSVTSFARWHRLILSGQRPAGETK
ncbi:MAG TPA: hypothetical protein PLR83_04285 [Pyrinomonadaceae bacterium]|nr:hypothetical protein [Pyrinomonadaceae bacterium]